MIVEGDWSGYEHLSLQLCSSDHLLIKLNFFLHFEMPLVIRTVETINNTVVQTISYFVDLQPRKKTINSQILILSNFRKRNILEFTLKRILYFTFLQEDQIIVAYSIVFVNILIFFTDDFPYIFCDLHLKGGPLEKYLISNEF